jgi:acyl-coenzyme A thioesterase PaaI-like protein
MHVPWSRSPWRRITLATTKASASTSLQPGPPKSADEVSHCAEHTRPVHREHLQPAVARLRTLCAGVTAVQCPARGSPSLLRQRRGGARARCAPRSASAGWLHSRRCYLLPGRQRDHLRGGSVLGGDLVTAGFTVDYLRPAGGARLRASAVVVHAGTSLAALRCDVHTLDSARDPMLCAIGQGRVSLRSTRG